MSDAPVRTSTAVQRVFRISELMIRYRPQRDGKAWRFVCMETGKLSTAEYTDEAMAKAGARMASAIDIDDLYQDHSETKR